MKYIILYNRFFKVLFSNKKMKYGLYVVKYNSGNGRNDAVVSASSPLRIKSLLEKRLKHEVTLVGSPIYKGFRTNVEGIVYDSSRSQPGSDCAEEGYFAHPFPQSHSFQQ